VTTSFPMITRSGLQGETALMRDRFDRKPLTSSIKMYKTEVFIQVLTTACRKWNI